jgi:uncharacterized protein with HEPN domain
MRDRLIHHYFDINLDVLWQTVKNDLPRLLQALPKIEDRADLPEVPAKITALKLISVMVRIWSEM